VATVEVINKRRSPPGLRPRLRTALAKLMDELGLMDKEVTVILCGDETMRRLKREFWGEDETTDVLSFPTYEEGDSFMPPHLGDVWINLQAAARQAEQAGHGLEDESLILAAHSLWHLLGHDHDDKNSWRGFEKVQKRILQL